MIRSIIWKNLNESEKLFLFKRNLKLNEDNEMKLKIKNILKDIKNNKDLALKKYTKEFDNILIDNFKVTQKEIEDSYSIISKEDKKAIYFAIENIEKYHKKIMPREIKVETKKGMICERLVKPINKVGLYVPGGNTPLVSSLMMLAVPAYIANCPNRILCTPPRQDGSIHPVLLATAKICKINDIYKVGGGSSDCCHGVWNAKYS
jgi:histidinol dehydrogenase